MMLSSYLMIIYLLWKVDGTFSTGFLNLSSPTYKYLSVEHSRKFTGIRNNEENLKTLQQQKFSSVYNLQTSVTRTNAKDLGLPLNLGPSQLQRQLYNRSNLSISSSNYKDHFEENFIPVLNNSHVSYNYDNIKKKLLGKSLRSKNISRFETADLLSDDIIYYSLNATFYRKVIPLRTFVKVVITSIDKDFADFLVVQAHSQNRNIVLSIDRQPSTENLVNATNAALIIFIEKHETSTSGDIFFYANNYHNEDLAVLFLVRNYTGNEPIPGDLFNPNATFSIPHPLLYIKQNLLTTLVVFPPATLYNISRLAAERKEDSSGLSVPLTPSSSIRYEVYLTYMYEGDLVEDHLFHTIVRTSTVAGLKANATKVADISNPPFPAEWIQELFISYSGVGAVVNVIASYNGSDGALYSSTVFYGCDFIDKDHYDCTKLISSFAKLFCASLLFTGVVLLLFGHRWLNFTMFISGFFTSWFILFVIFVQGRNPDTEVLGILTMLGAIVGGIGWLVLWHKFRRPFHSALLVILMSSFFAAMISTHFLKYAIVPSRKNLTAFIVFPIAFSVSIIGYSIFHIKNVHIFSCCLLGSYCVVMPFAFYFGSSLTYIVINVISTMVVRDFSRAVGFPPFQYCDIILLCVWISLFFFGIFYQTYRERAGPPFYPPNASVFKAIFSALKVAKEKLTQSLSCCRRTADDDSLLEDDSVLSRIFPCTCIQNDRTSVNISEYESFPRIGADEGSSSFKDVVLRPFRNGFGFVQRMVTRTCTWAQRDCENINSNFEDVQPLDREESRATDDQDLARV